MLAAVRAALQYHPRVAWSTRINTGAGRLQYRDGGMSQFMRFGWPGAPDFIGIERGTGRWVAVEVKRPTGTLRPEQAEFLEMVRRNGGIAFVARSIDDVEACLG